MNPEVDCEEPAAIDDLHPRKIIEDREFKKDVLLIAQQCLEERPLFIFKKRFGLDGEEPMTLKEISKILRISGERVRVILRLSIYRIRKHFK